MKARYVTGTAPASLRPEHPVARSLSGLAAEFGFEVIGDAGGVELTGVTLDSRDVRAGDLYVGMPGLRTHGASFAPQAISAGAVAVLTDAAGATLVAAQPEGAGVPIVVTPDPRAALGFIAAWVYRTDELEATLFAVTGTNGKTSVVYVLAAILEQLGATSALTSTAERRVGSDSVPSSLTTPEASQLHALLARAREQQVRGAAIEVSAQALTRHRVDGVVFDVAGFTNLSHDHLDDYASMDDYFLAKLELFQPDRAQRGVVTVDEPWGERLAVESRIPITTLTSVQGAAAEWRVSAVDSGLDRTRFTLTGPDGRSLTTSIPLLGSFMAANAALAIVMLVESGFDLDAIAQALERDGGIDVYIPGRTEKIAGETGPVVVVDYAHTPDGFARTLGALRDALTADEARAGGRLIMVFGADGDRDTTKRAEMGAIAARGADALVVTDYNPRFEEPASIRAALIAGARDAVPDVELYELPDQRRALRRAIELAGRDGIVFYPGPGHEDHQEVAGMQIPYSARDDARLALAEAGWF